MTLVADCRFHSALKKFYGVVLSLLLISDKVFGVKKNRIVCEALMVFFYLFFSVNLGSLRVRSSYKPNNK